MGYLYVALTVLFTVYGQLVLKWQIGSAGVVLDGVEAKIIFLLKALSNLWILSGLASAFVASLFWILALTKLPLSSAYPFTAMGFVLVSLFSVTVLGETLGPWKALGTTLVVVGILVLTVKTT